MSDGKMKESGTGRSGGADSERDQRVAKARVYFSQPGFTRMLKEVWKRYASLEKTGGHAIVSKANAEECEAINAFFGWYKKPGDDIRVPLAKFERELLGSAFPFTIAELHEVLTGESLRTKSDRVLLAMREWQALFDAVEAQFAAQGTQPRPEVAGWLTGLREGRAAGYRTLRELWRDSPEVAQRELTHAVKAWNLLLAGDAALGLGGNDSPSSIIRLPVLAALATGDPHALDRNVPAGRLLFQVLRSASRDKVLAEANGAGLAGDIDPPSRTEPTDPDSSISLLDRTQLPDPDGIPGLSSGVDTLEARGIYRSAGILDDDISSLVHVYCPMEELMEPYVLTLRQVEGAASLPQVTDLYIVENPAVFSTLVDLTENSGIPGMTALNDNPLVLAKTGGRDGETKVGDIGKLRVLGPMLLCTSGPASAAALRLMDRYLEEGLVSGNLFYSGDYDVKGIEIGNVLALRYEGRFAAWRFNRGSYLEECTRAIPGGVPFSPEEMLRLGKLQAVWDPSLCDTMGGKGYKLFQEQFIATLADDWKMAVKGREIG
ncbi:TIGR02679 domain-containing protein [Paenibacillus lactis]|uniref:TIGR02679 domain-containing protein n=1 Tax=Paenibacillus lactis TaxID=228574 RepID=UPI003686717A